MKKMSGCLIVLLLLLSSNTVRGKAEPIRSTSNLYEQNTMSVLWFQKSGEAKALYYQGYNIGKVRLDDILNKRPKNKKSQPAIVLDIDETILDNSPYLSWFVLNGQGSPFDWSVWFNRGEAKALPGAIEFLRYADAKGVAIYYISNRMERQKASTMKNLRKVGAPQVNQRHVLLQQPGEKGKEGRRQEVSKSNEIVLYFGDNLRDFSGFDNLSVSGRMEAVDKRKEDIGRSLIVFPNPMYGDWEEAIYNYDFRKTDKEKEKLRKINLQSYTN